MPVVGRADEDHVDVVARDHFLVGAVDVDAARGCAAVLFPAVGFLDAVAHFLRLAAHDVAHGNDAAVLGAAGKDAEVMAADEAVADEADREPVARRGFTEERGREKIRRDAGGDDAGETALEESAAIEQCVHGVECDEREGKKKRRSRRRKTSTRYRRPTLDGDDSEPGRIALGPCLTGRATNSSVHFGFRESYSTKARGVVLRSSAVLLAA